MSRLLERRKQILRLMRGLTLDNGFFTVSDLTERIHAPRSTVQDWVTRLLEEGCILLKEGKRGRHPAEYVAISTLPQSACRRIFTTVDGDQVEIYHKCMSAGCAAFCEHHHRSAGGALVSVVRDGNLLRERAHLCERDAEIGLHPLPAVGVVGVMRDGEDIVQQIKCVGGPAYSLTDMMSKARGVSSVRVHKSGDLVEGRVTTRALTYLAIGIDDTDSREGGATFALALALLQHLSGIRGVMPIGHRVAMLNPVLMQKTAGNSCSYIELAAEEGVIQRIEDAAIRFVGDESLSREWGIAVKQGFVIPPEMRNYGRRVREAVVSKTDAGRVARGCGVRLHGGEGVIGALAAISMIGLPDTVLLDPAKEMRWKQ